MSLLIDTGVLFAFLNNDDARHGQAVGAIERIARGEWGTPLVSDYVVDELFTLIRARTGNPDLETAAKRLLPFPKPMLPRLQLVPVGPRHLDATLALFLRHRTRRLSFTDASILALMPELGIETLATFDDGFDGLAEIVP
ncbi:MAG: type II toxin-antitoxin system VapC family toxin [Euryarchaeota archaeon]|nr:type II toxin-antitoxin system VapC family toxin [Euryarchaeota archaeon]